MDGSVCEMERVGAIEIARRAAEVLKRRREEELENIVERSDRGGRFRYQKTMQGGDTEWE